MALRISGRETTWLAAAFGCWIGAVGAALAFETQDDVTVGTQMMNFHHKNNFWWQVDFALFDGKETSFPPTKSRLDRRIESALRLGKDFAFSSVTGVRLNVKANSILRKQEDEEEPKLTAESTAMQYRLGADVTYQTASGVDLVAGIELWQIPAYEDASTADGASSKQNFGAASAMVPRFGVFKSTAAWDGGVYYTQSVEVQRNVVKTASDGSGVTVSDTVHSPTTIAVFGGTTTGDLRIEGELATVQAGDGGSRSTTGDSVRENFLRAQVNAFKPLAGSTLKLGASHQTLSYSVNEFIQVDQVPTTSLRCVVLFGSATDHSFLGLIYGQGKDRQSLESRNAQYEFKAVALTMGLFTAM